MKLNLRDLDEDGTVRALAPYGVSPIKARRVFTCVHRDGATTVRGVVGLAQSIAERIDADAVWPDLTIIERRRSADGFVKYLFGLPDGGAVEAVRIPLPSADDAQRSRELRRQGLAKPLQELPTAKYTVCVSSQAGCALACDFCSTGRLGSGRNLATWEILAQVRLAAADAAHPVRGVVFMGMGEPLLNYENVLRAASVLRNPAGPAVGSKAITISTAGVAPAIRRFTSEGHRYRLIFSLGAPTSEQRRIVMPVEKRWPLEELMEAIRAYAATTTQRITFAYVMLGGVNTTPEHAEQLRRLLEGLKVRINLIDVCDSSGRYRPPTADELAGFRQALQSLGAPIVRRYSGGGDISAACGTLSLNRTGGEALESSH